MRNDLTDTVVQVKWAKANDAKSQFPYKFVNLFFILVLRKDKLTDLWGN